MDKLDKEIQLNNFIRIYDNILPENVLKSFLKICQNHQTFEDSKVIGNNFNQEVNQEIRKTLVWYLKNLDGETSFTNIHWCSVWVHHFEKYLKRYLDDLNINTGVKVADIQVLKYINHGHYTFHIDHGAATPRTISCIFLINDNYKGGELVFGSPSMNATSTVEKKANRMIIWPSNFLYPHSVKPVTEGIRYSVVSWAL